MGDPLPYFPFYTKDWLSDAFIRMLNPTAKGLYIDALAMSWQEGGLPSDLTAIARLLGYEPRVVRRFWPDIAEKFEERGGRLVNRKLERLRRDAEEVRRKRSRAGKASGEARRAHAEQRTLVEDVFEHKGEHNGEQTPNTLVEQPLALAHAERETDMSSKLDAEWEEWLDHFRSVTGRRTPGSQQARRFFNARREDYELDELKLATVGCHSDEHLRERGFDRPETILRDSNVGRYVELGRKVRPDRGVDAFVRTDEEVAAA